MAEEQQAVRCPQQSRQFVHRHRRQSRAYAQPAPCQRSPEVDTPKRLLEVGDTTSSPTDRLAAHFLILHRKSRAMQYRSYYALGPVWVKSGKVQNEQMLSALPPIVLQKYFWHLV